MEDNKYKDWTNYETYQCALALGIYESDLNKAVQHCRNGQEVRDLVGSVVYADGASHLTNDIIQDWLNKVNFEEIWENGYNGNWLYDDLPYRLVFVE
tara:strand:- start:384 stop:674 length:291 start_codon:yes stop_codon:yes gene_type:complete